MQAWFETASKIDLFVHFDTLYGLFGKPTHVYITYAYSSTNSHTHVHIDKSCRFYFPSLHLSVMR